MMNGYTNMKIRNQQRWERPATKRSNLKVINAPSQVAKAQRGANESNNPFTAGIGEICQTPHMGQSLRPLKPAMKLKWSWEYGKHYRNRKPDVECNTMGFFFLMVCLVGGSRLVHLRMKSKDDTLRIVLEEPEFSSTADRRFNGCDLPKAPRKYRSQ